MLRKVNGLFVDGISKMSFTVLAILRMFNKNFPKHQR